MTAVPGAPGPAAPRGPSFVRSAAGVAVATGLGNLAIYVLYAALSRALGPTSYGAFAALAGLAFVAAVPAVAAQAVVARRVAVADLHVGDPAAADGLRGLVRWAHHLGMALTVIAAAATPAMIAFLHLPGPGGALWTAAWLYPTAVVGAYLGILQGTGRLASFGRLFLVAALLRLACSLAGGLIGSTAGVGLSGAVAGSAVAAGLSVLVGARMVGVGPWRGRRTTERGITGELVTAALGLLGVVVLTNTDLLLARHYLGAHESGLYAVGSIITKGVFFLPAFIGFVGFRSFTDAARRRATIGRALAAVVAVSAVAVLGAAVLAGPVIRAASGSEYAGVADDAWLFAALGGALAVIQLLVYAGIATEDHRLRHLVWVAVVAEVALIVAGRHDSVKEIVTTALAVTTTLAVVGAVVVLGRRTTTAPTAEQPPLAWTAD
jgi:O-antigen/teichoic acid export membrane protein